MRMIGTGFLLVATMSFNAAADDASLDRNSLERKYIKCIEESFRDECFSMILKGKFVQWYKDQEKVLANTEEFYSDWMAGIPVYKVHMVDKKLAAGIFDNRSYLIERSDGEISGIFIGFRKVKDAWYVYDIQGGVSDSFIRRLIDMPRLVDTAK